MLTDIGLLFNQSAAPHRPPLRGCRNPNRGHWLYRRPHASKRSLQHSCFHSRCSRFFDAARRKDGWYSVCRCLSRCDGDLSLYFKHDFLDE